MVTHQRQRCKAPSHDVATGAGPFIRGSRIYAEGVLLGFATTGPPL